MGCRGQIHDLQTRHATSACAELNSPQAKERLMIDRSRFVTLASATALTLALGQALAEQPAAPAPAAQPDPAAAAPEAPPAPPAPVAAPESGADAAQAAMEQRWAEAMAEREKRWEAMRARAAEQGMELPETPPWAQGGMPQMPAAPSMPEGMPMMPQGFSKMTPEERRALREKRWEEMRARAAEQGMEFPETPPWEAAEQRRQEMMERYTEYRNIIEAMTDEQKEAISALFGGYRGPMGGPGMGPGMRPGMGPGMMPGYPSQPDMPAPEAAAGAAPEAPAQPSN